MFSYLHYSKIVGAFRAFSRKITRRAVYITLVLGLVARNTSRYNAVTWTSTMGTSPGSQVSIDRSAAHLELRGAAHDT
jgi:hypothetical protein